MTRRRKLTSEVARQMGLKGGAALAAKRRAAKLPPAPYAGDLLDAMTDSGLVGASWDAWRCFLKSALALPLSPPELEVFRACTGRLRARTHPSVECWAIVGRRGGKSRVASVAAFHAAVSRDWHAALAPGETGVLMLIASDRRQARVLLAYVRALSRLPVFAPLIKRVLRDSIETRLGSRIEVVTASAAAPRGLTAIGAVCDEVAWWRSGDDGANPAADIFAAIRPAMAGVAGARLLAITTPYRATDEAGRAFERGYGRDDAEPLVWRAPTLTMNNALDPQIVAKALEDDPAAASAEYLAQFRSDLAAWIDTDAVRAVTIADRRELAPQAGIAYKAFADASGGRSDAFALGIAHAEPDGRVILDLAREIGAPFNPTSAVAEHAATLAAFGCFEVCGDKYSAQWVVEAFAKHGIQYRASERNKSAIYAETLALILSQRCELLDVARLAQQLGALERRTARGGARDVIDHPIGGRDDLANACCGALLEAASGTGGAYVSLGDAGAGFIAANCGLSRPNSLLGLDTRWPGGGESPMGEDGDGSLSVAPDWPSA